MPEVLDEKKLSTFRRYFLEVCLLVLAGCLGFTVNFVINLNNNFFKYVMDDKSSAIIQMQKSTDALNNNTDALKDIIQMRKDFINSQVSKNNFNNNQNEKR